MQLSTRKSMQVGKPSGSFCRLMSATSTVELNSKPCVISLASLQTFILSLAGTTAKLSRSGIWAEKAREPGSTLIRKYICEEGSRATREECGRSATRRFYPTLQEDVVYPDAIC